MPIRLAKVQQKTEIARQHMGEKYPQTSFCGLF